MVLWKIHVIISDHFVETRNRGTAGQNLERTQTVDYWVELGAATQVCFKTLVFSVLHYVRF